MATKPSIPKGTRDFGPVEMLRRKYIFSTIEKVFQKYGYLPLETPAMENLETLTGKYGEEGDRLIFKILQRGDKFSSAVESSVGKSKTLSRLAEFIKRTKVELSGLEMRMSFESIEQEGDGSVQHKISQEVESELERLSSDLALRYDLTVPFARYVVQNQNELAFPFKRYQIQPVWRADRPQKGRYREFYQCDADVIGSTSLLNEVELVQMIDEVFTSLGVRTVTHVNNRKVLTGLAVFLGLNKEFNAFATALDKLEKIGRARVFDELGQFGVDRAQLDQLDRMLDSIGSTEKSWPDAKKDLEWAFRDIPIGLEGLKEIDFLWKERPFGYGVGSNTYLKFDITLARGLDYYTGAIFEVKAAEGTLQSSICGGGRYDDLTGIFGLKNMSGVGISFGADRIYDVLLETNKFPAELGSSTKLLFANFGEKEAMHCLKLLREVREAGIAAELYPDQVKLPKQFTYAEKKGIPYVAIVGETEMNDGVVTLKKMGANEKGTMMPIAEMIALLKDQS